MTQDASTELPLPHGTDVITRVARSVRGDDVAAGTIGRIIATHGEEFDVHILHIGTVRYRRNELTPFRSGQLRYAVARETAWTALRDTVVLEAVVGSRAWGLADESSDTDVRGLFVLPFPWTARIAEAPATLISADGSSTYWEVARVVSNALRADPNTLELLFVESVRASDPMGEWILASREAFVSSRIYASFGQYAFSQLKRLERSLRLAEHRDVVLEWLRMDPTLTLNATAARLAESARIPAANIETAESQAREYLKQLYASLFDAGVIAEKSFRALVAFAQVSRESSALPRHLRPKNAYNLVRLLITATGWLRAGAPVFEMTGPVRSELLAIKHGEVELRDVLRRAEDLSRQMDDAHRNTALPSSPDVEQAQSLLLRIREEAARRWFGGDQVPFGRSATTVVSPEWQS